MSGSVALPLDGQVALVTGANRGIGFEVARTLARLGAMVWLGCRDQAHSGDALRRITDDGLAAELVTLDVTDRRSVDEAASRVSSAGGRLDILVNNAGIALDAGVPPSEVGMTIARSTFDTNVFGAIQVTQAFLPLLRRSPAGRIVMVSSDIGSQTHQTDPTFPFYDLNPMIYAASKAALNAITIAFSKELLASGIKVNAANPGFTATDLNGHRGINTVEQGAAPVITLATLLADGPTGTFLGPYGTEPW